MKRDKQQAVLAVECTIPNCVECALCKAMVSDEEYAEVRTGNEQGSLYSAEVLGYDFYFLSANAKR